MQIPHPFSGSIQQYLAEIAGVDRYRRRKPASAGTTVLRELALCAGQDEASVSASRLIPFSNSGSGGRRQLFLQATLDHPSQLIPHAGSSASQGLDAALDCLRQAIAARGVPTQLYAPGGNRGYPESYYLVKAITCGAYLGPTPDPETPGYKREFVPIFHPVREIGGSGRLDERTRIQSRVRLRARVRCGCSQVEPRGDFSMRCNQAMPPGPGSGHR